MVQSLPEGRSTREVSVGDPSAQVTNETDGTKPLRPDDLKTTDVQRENYCSTISVDRNKKGNGDRI